MKCQNLLNKWKILLYNGLIQVLQNPMVNASRNLFKASSGAKCSKMDFTFISGHLMVLNERVYG